LVAGNISNIQASIKFIAFGYIIISVRSASLYHVLFLVFHFLHHLLDIYFLDHLFVLWLMHHFFDVYFMHDLLNLHVPFIYFFLHIHLISRFKINFGRQIDLASQNDVLRSSQRVYSHPPHMNSWHTGFSIRGHLNAVSYHWPIKQNWTY